MKEKLKKIVSFPYLKEYEDGYNRNLTKSLYKPLLITVIAVLLFVTWIIFICIFMPDIIAPATHIRGLVFIHSCFMTFTIVILILAIVYRKQLLDFPKRYILLCNSYAIGVCLWSCVLSAYASYSPAVYTAFVFVTLCVAMVAQFKPWMAIIVFLANYLFYIGLTIIFHNENRLDYIALLFNAGLAAFLGMVISISFYRFRVRTYYGQQIILAQMKEIHSINEELQQLIHIDTLTGLYNRRFYDEVLPSELKHMQTLPGIICAMMFDVDFFKNYNDLYGHTVGDVCLKKVASAIQSKLHNAGYAVRYGGEEFFILTQLSSPAEATFLAEEIRLCIAEEYIVHGGSPFEKVTVSGGISFMHKNLSLTALTKAADEALYTAKQNGRNQIVAQ